MYNYLRPTPLRYLSHIRLSLTLSLSYAVRQSHYPSHTMRRPFPTLHLSCAVPLLPLRRPTHRLASSFSHLCTVLVPPLHRSSRTFALSLSHLRTVLLTRIVPHLFPTRPHRGPLHHADPTSTGSPSPRVTLLPRAV